jgi:hypothetical protein
MRGSLTSCLREPVFKFLSIRPNADMVQQRDFFALSQVRSTLQHTRPDARPAPADAVAHALAWRLAASRHKYRKHTRGQLFGRLAFLEPAPSRSRLGNEIAHGCGSTLKRSHDPSAIAIPDRLCAPSRSRTATTRIPLPNRGREGVGSGRSAFRFRAATVRGSGLSVGCGRVSGERAAARFISTSENMAA